MRRALPCLALAILAAPGGGCELSGEDVVYETEALAAVEGRWVALGGDLGPDPAAYLGRPSLAVTPVRPAVAVWSVDPTSGLDTTTVSRWIAGAWEEVGALEGARPVIAAGGRNRLYVCHGAGPFVVRWNGASWIAVGGDIASEAGFRAGRYLVEGCQGMVFAGDGEPVVAWSADVGAKANLVFAARWSRGERRWIGVGDGAIGPRATDAAIAMDARGRLVVATFTPGGSYGGGNTTRVFRRDSAAWTQLGDDAPGTSEPTVAVHGPKAYLAHGASDPDLPPAVTVMQWRQGGWQVIAPALPGDGPTIAFTRSGKLLLAYRASDAITGDPAASALRVVRLAHGEWHRVGDDVADLTARVAWQAIAVDALGRPVVAWREQDGAGAALFVRRFSAALP
ncbi:MAG TPA: hypothetical protein VFU21_32500 [Kofleriaceae bacterium]|nr:hypothetical protein [Kofleriaceae bacterium]